MTLPIHLPNGPREAGRTTASDRGGSIPRTAARKALDWVVVVATCLAFLTPTPGAAKTSKASASDRESARNLMDIGRQKSAAGDHAGALEAYLGADELMRVPTTGLAVADALREVGRLIEAREKALAVTRMPERKDESKPFARARKRAQELSTLLATLIPSIQVEVLTIESEDPVDDATVRLDGESLEATVLKLPRKLDPGKHTVAATAVGFDTAVKTVELGEGEHHAVTVVLRRMGDEPVRTIGDVSPLVWIGYGLTVVGAVAGAATGSAALAKSAALEADCPGDLCPSDEQSAIDSMDLMSHLSTASFAVAGAGAVLGTIGVVLSMGSDGPGRETARVVPALGPGFVGVRGQF